MKTGFSFKKLLVATGILSAVIVPYSASAYEPASQACKDCVMKCVMGDRDSAGKELKLCLSRSWDTKTGDCNPACPNVNRVTLGAELKQVALKKCETSLADCLIKAGNDDRKILLCRAEEASCRSNTNRFELH